MARIKYPDPIPGRKYQLRQSRQLRSAPREITTVEVTGLHTATDGLVVHLTNSSGRRTTCTRHSFISAYNMTPLPERNPEPEAVEPTLSTGSAGPDAISRIDCSVDVIRSYVVNINAKLNAIMDELDINSPTQPPE